MKVSDRQVINGMGYKIRTETPRSVTCRNATHMAGRSPASAATLWTACYPGPALDKARADATGDIDGLVQINSMIVRARRRSVPTSDSAAW
ncbi:hypothetical protein SCANM124S_00137 [Streptomyces canus]